MEEKIPGDANNKRLRLAYWYVTHKIQLRAALTVFLAVIAIGFSGYVLYGLTRLYIIDYPSYRAMEQQASVSLVNPDAIPRARAIELRTVQVFDAGSDRVDAIATIKNPNNQFYATFDYQFVGEGGETKEQHGFILPSEEKIVTELGIPTQTRFRSARLEIRNVRWKRINAHEIADYPEFQQSHLNIFSEDVQFIPGATADDVSRVTFMANNPSAYGFWNVKFVVLLYRGRSAVAANEIEVSQFESGQKRPVTVTWFEKLPQVTNIEVHPVVNILDPSVYMPPKGE